MAQPEVVHFLVSNEIPHFLITTPKFQLQIHHTFEVIPENVPIFSIPILIFLCIFITISPTVSHTFFAPGEKIRSNLVVKFYDMCLRGQVQSVESKNTHVKMGTSPFR